MSSGTKPQSKPELRQHFRQQRQQLEEPQRSAWDKQINEHLLGLPMMSAGGRIAAYWCFDGEPDLRPALDVLNETGARIFLPVVPEQAGAGMELHPWSPDHAMSSGRLGQFEPEAGEAVGIETLDVVLIPLVAWDRHGGRLGMGAAYYDRFLEPVRDADKPLRIGVAYSVQEAEALPAEPWDVPLHALVSEQGLIRFEPV